MLAWDNNYTLNKKNIQTLSWLILHQNIISDSNLNVQIWSSPKLRISIQIS